MVYFTYLLCKIKVFLNSVTCSTDHVEVLETCTNTLHHILALGVRGWAGVERRVEAGAHLLDAGLQLLALEERHKHRLVDLVALKDN